MEIQEIKERLNIVQALAHYGLKMNRNKHINCPFHEDKTPSMKVYEETNTVYCFSGNCSHSGKSMDVIELVQQLEKCNKHEAILKCKSLLNYVAPVINKEEDAGLSEIEILQSLWTNFVVSFKSPRCKARAYAESRGLSLEGLGYNTGSWHKRKDRTEEELNQAEEIGYLRLSTFNKGRNAWGKNCLIFPLKNEENKVVSFYGRAVKVSGHYYLPNRTGLYHAYPSKKATKIILTESVIDAASLSVIEELKDYEVLALYGTNGYTAEHKKALQSCGELEEVILMLDGDEAGQKASTWITTMDL